MLRFLFECFKKITKLIFLFEPFAWKDKKSVMNNKLTFFEEFLPAISFICFKNIFVIHILWIFSWCNNGFNFIKTQNWIWSKEFASERQQMKHLLHRLVTHWRSTHYNQVCLQCNRLPTNDIAVRCHVIFLPNWNVAGCSKLDCLRQGHLEAGAPTYLLNVFVRYLSVQRLCL